VLRVHKEIGAATVYVTHDQVEAMTMGDRIAVLHAGALQQYGPPREVYARPANLFVAQFIGSPEMNVYQASVDPAGCLVLGSQRLALGPAYDSVASYAGRKVIVGVRPEDLMLGPAGTQPAKTLPARTPPAGVPTLMADIRVVEPLGSEIHAFFSIDAPVAGERELAAAAGETDSMQFGQAYNGVARLDPRAMVRPGDRVAFRVDASRLYFFDPDTGAAIATSPAS
jgi:multiple sugar transport system ATP-binding protein